MPAAGDTSTTTEPTGQAGRGFGAPEGDAVSLVDMPRGADVHAVGVLGLGHALPDRAVDNHELAETLDTSDEWIQRRTGIKQRHVADPDEATSDLATLAGAAALADAGIAATDLAAVVVATMTPDHPMPATGALVAAALGTTCMAFDVNAACSGFVYGLRVAAGLAASGPVLLVGADLMARTVDPEDRSTAVLFGDGAAAVVLARDVNGRGLLGPFDIGADGLLADALITPAGGTRQPVTGPDDKDRYLTMKGSEVYRQAVAHMVESCEDVLRRADLEATDVDLLVGHQANARILEAVGKRLGIREDRVVLTVAEHGNTSAASIPLALAATRAEGRLAPGARLLLTAVGGGLTWGSCLLTWDAPVR